MTDLSQAAPWAVPGWCLMTCAAVFAILYLTVIGGVLVFTWNAVAAPARGLGLETLAALLHEAHMRPFKGDDVLLLGPRAVAFSERTLERTARRNWIELDRSTATRSPATWRSMSLARLFTRLRFGHLVDDGPTDFVLDPGTLTTAAQLAETASRLRLGGRIMHVMQNEADPSPLLAWYRAHHWGIRRQAITQRRWLRPATRATALVATKLASSGSSVRSTARR